MSFLTSNTEKELGVGEGRWVGKREMKIYDLEREIKILIFHLQNTILG